MTLFSAKVTFFRSCLVVCVSQIGNAYAEKPSTLSTPSDTVSACVAYEVAISTVSPSEYIPGEPQPFENLRKVDTLEAEVRLISSVRAALQSNSIVKVHRLEVSDGPISKGASESFLFRFENGITGIFKLDESYQSSASEVAAFELDRALKIGMVPPTVKRQYMKLDGSVQYFVKGLKMVSHARWASSKEVGSARFFDYLTGNFDREYADHNFALDTAGRILLIDNGTSFPRHGASYYNIKNVDTLKSLVPTDLKVLSTLIEIEPDEWRLRLGVLSTASINGFLSRRKRLLNELAHRETEGTLKTGVYIPATYGETDLKSTKLSQ